MMRCALLSAFSTEALVRQPHLSLGPTKCQGRSLASRQRLTSPPATASGLTIPAAPSQVQGQLQEESQAPSPASDPLDTPTSDTPHQLSSNDPEELGQALEGLWSATCGDSAASTCDMLHEAGVVPRLVELLSSSHLKVQLSAAATLGNILGHLPAACTAAAAADAVPVLIQLISIEPDDMRLQRYAVGALESIIDHAQLSAASMRPAVGPLVQLLAKDDTRTQNRAAGCLWSVVRHDEEGREEALAAGAAEHLVELLQCASAIHEVALLHQCLMALGILTPHPTVKRWVQAYNSSRKAVV